MPIHHIPRARLDEDVRDIERQGEEIVSVTVDTDGRYLVVTRYRVAPTQYETRVAS
jgi:hypothetical protein